MSKYNSEFTKKLLENCSDEYKKQRAERLKDRMNKFTTHAGDFTIELPQKPEKDK